MAKKHNTENVGERLEEMLGEQSQAPAIEVVKDNTPPPGKSLQEIESSLTNDYNRVQQQKASGHIDRAFVQDLAGKFLAIAENPELRNKVSFDAARAYDVLYDLASGQQKDVVEEVWHVRRTTYR